MPKKTLYHGAHVLVNVEQPLRKVVTPKDWYAAAETLRQDIERHCDVGSSTVELDLEEVCEFCGWEWTEMSDTYNECCEEDNLAHEKVGLQ